MWNVKPAKPSFFARTRNDLLTPQGSRGRANSKSLPGAGTVKAEYDVLTTLVRSCHQLTLQDPNDGLAVHLKVGLRKFTVTGDRAFLISLHARYMGVPINLAMTGAGVRNDEVTVLTMGVEKSATYEARLAKGLLREQVAKLERQLR